MPDIATLTSKGQVTIPKDLRDELGLRPGDQLEFTRCEGVVTVRKIPAASVWDRWRGYATWLKGTDPDELIEDWRGR